MTTSDKTKTSDLITLETAADLAMAEFSETVTEATVDEHNSIAAVLSPAKRQQLAKLVDSLEEAQIAAEISDIKARFNVTKLTDKVKAAALSKAMDNTDDAIAAKFAAAVEEGRVLLVLRDDPNFGKHGQWEDRLRQLGTSPSAAKRKIQIAKYFDILPDRNPAGGLWTETEANLWISTGCHVRKDKIAAYVARNPDLRAELRVELEKRQPGRQLPSNKPGGDLVKPGDKATGPAVNETETPSAPVPPASRHTGEAIDRNTIAVRQDEAAANLAKLREALSAVVGTVELSVGARMIGAADAIAETITALAKAHAEARAFEESQAGQDPVDRGDSPDADEMAAEEQAAIAELNQ